MSGSLRPEIRTSGLARAKCGHGLAAIVARAKLAAMPTPDATPPDSSHKLAHVLVLDDGTKLVTLRDAANVLTERFGTVISWRVIELIEQLLRADASGARADIEATTDATERVLRARRLL
jgi:hypothetical protein